MMENQSSNGYKIVGNKQDTKKETKKFKWFAFGCLTSIALIILFITTFFVGLAIFGKRTTPQIKQHTVLNLIISGNLEEHREVDDSFFSLTPSPTASDIIRKINLAAEDNSVDGILLEPRFIVAGYPVLNELIEALDNFKQSGKFIYSYMEMASNRDYYLASVADRVYLNPASSSGIYLSGTSITSLYMKDLLDKLGVEMTVLHSGRFKGVGEEYVRQDMSTEMKESLNNLLDHYYQQFMKDISSRRDMSMDAIQHLLEERDDLLITGQNAIDYDLVDILNTRELILEELKDGGLSRILSFNSYRPKDKTVKRNDIIAVVYLQGIIAASTEGIFDIDTYLSSSKVKRLLTNLKTDDRVKAIVLRVNSPGGSALESDIIYHIINDVKESKPIVVSMGNSAASGGYYISAPADYIVADNYTLTGSIGVAGMIPNIHNMGQSIGINPETISRGKFSNFLNPWEPINPEEIQSLQRNLDNVYDEFIQRVSTGRDMPSDQVHQVAQGRIWTSKDALELGLIDEVGTLSVAIDKAAELQGIMEYEVITYPKTRSLFDIIIDKRFSVSLLKDITLLKLLPEDKVKQYLEIIKVLKNDTIHFMSPIIIIDN